MSILVWQSTDVGTRVQLEQYTAVTKQSTAGDPIGDGIAFGCWRLAEAVERGLRRREAAGKETSTMGPVCTIMVGRLDD
jgi:transaldolase